MTHYSELLRLLQLASPALPVGAYSYSEGLEYLVHCGTIQNQLDLEHWLTQELTYGAVRLEAALMVRAYRATEAEDFEALTRWNGWLSAARETEELRSQSHQMGRSLLRLTQAIAAQPPVFSAPQLRSLAKDGVNFAIAFGYTAAHWQIACDAALLGYLQGWATNLINAGIKLIPLGQTTGQQLLWQLHAPLETAVSTLLNLADDDLYSCGWGLALASMAHETQYSRLFRS